MQTAGEVNSDVINFPRSLSTHPSSVTQSTGDITRGSLLLNTGVLEQKTLTLSTNDGNIFIQGLKVTATKFRSQAIVEITPESGTNKPYTSFTIQDLIDLNAEAAIAYTRFSLDQGSGGASFHSGLRALASSDISLVEGN